MGPLPAANPWRRSRPTCSNSTCAKPAKPAWRPSPASSVNWPWTIRGGLPLGPQAPSPYPGLLCFDQEGAALNFGRDGEICDLIARLQELRIQGAQRLLPRLARSGRHWLPLPPFRPQSKPCQQLA